jgi:phosphohistidine phosphatase
VQIYFLRHGLADREAWDGEDFARPLTPRGRKRMVREARALARIGISPDVILTSPLARARQTAEIVGDVLGVGPRLRAEDRLQPGFGVSDLVAIVHDNPGLERMMVVGHNPDFSLVVGSLIGGAEVVFKKGALARVDVLAPDVSSGELVWLLPPKVLVVAGE